MLTNPAGISNWMRMAISVAICSVVLIGLQPGGRQLRAAAPLSDVVEVKFDEWMTPSVRPFPHDPAAARDGSVWYTGQLSNVVGHLDPTTGRFREYSLPTANSGPHGLVEDPDGNIWYTGNAAGLIGKIDIKSGTVTEHKMPDPQARDPHSLVFSRSGVIVFTVQVGNFVGTLDPKTGKVDADSTGRERAPVRHRAQLEGCRVLRRVRDQQDRQPQSVDAQGDGVPAARRRRAAATDQRSAATIRSITPTTRADISATSIRRPGRSRSSSRPAAPTRCRTA